MISNKLKLNSTLNLFRQQQTIGTNYGLKHFSSSSNYEKFSKYKDQRKQFEQEFQRQKQRQQQEKHERNQYKKQSREQETQEEHIHFQGQAHTPIKIPIFKILFKLLSTIVVSIIRRKLFSSSTEYKELYQFTTRILQEKKELIKQVAESSKINLDSPKILNTSYIPSHSQFGNKEDQIMMVLEIPSEIPQSPFSDNRSIGLNVVTLAKALPDVVVQSKFPWNLFGDGTEVVKDAEPLRVTLLVDIDTIDNFGFVVNEKREIPLYNTIDPDDGFGGEEFDIFENHQQQKQSKSKSNTNNKHETIVLDPKDYHEVYNNKKR